MVSVRAIIPLGVPQKKFLQLVGLVFGASFLAFIFSAISSGPSQSVLLGRPQHHSGCVAEQRELNAKQDVCDAELHRLLEERKELIEDKLSDYNGLLRSHRALSALWSEQKGPAEKENKLAVIIPVRSGEMASQNRLLDSLSRALDRGDLNYTLFLFEQSNTTLFNPGFLFNAAVLALLNSDYSYLCFHDYTIIPSGDVSLYRPHPHLPYLVTPPGLHPNPAHRGFGGVVILPRETFILANGFPVDGWGQGIDDAFETIGDKLQVLGLWPPATPDSQHRDTSFSLQEGASGHRDLRGSKATIDKSKGLKDTEYWVLDLKPYLGKYIHYTLELLCNRDKTPWCKPT